MFDVIQVLDFAISVSVLVLKKKSYYTKDLIILKTEILLKIKVCVNLVWELYSVEESSNTQLGSCGKAIDNSCHCLDRMVDINSVV